MDNVSASVGDLLVPLVYAASDAEIAARRCYVNRLEDAVLEQMFGSLPFEDRYADCHATSPAPTPSELPFVSILDSSIPSVDRPAATAVACL